MKIVKKLNPVVIKKKIGMTAAILLTITVIGGYFGFVQFQEYTAINTALAEARSKLENLKLSESTVRAEFVSLKGSFDGELRQVNNNLEEILPKNEDFTKLLRSLDEYFRSRSTTSQPIFLSDVRFGAPQFPENLEYAILPITMNVEGTQQAIKNFLIFVEQTGDTNSAVRLLDIDSINLNFRDDEEENKSNPMLSVSLQMKSYFQKPEKK